MGSPRAAGPSRIGDPRRSGCPTRRASVGPWSTLASSGAGLVRGRGDDGSSVVTSTRRRVMRLATLALACLAAGPVAPQSCDVPELMDRHVVKLHGHASADFAARVEALGGRV